MPQWDIARATPLASRERSVDISEAAAGGGRLRVFGAWPDRAALAALLPEFVIEKRSGEPGRDPLAFVAWSDMPAAGRARRRSAALGMPFVLLGEGLLL